MAERTLRRVRPDDVPATRRGAVDAATLASASAIVDDVRRGGEAALRAHAERLGDLAPGDPLVIGRDALAAALAALPAARRDVLSRTAARIRAFAEAQRAALADVRVEVPGGLAGHAVVPVDRAGCYAPGGRFPLPSSVLMTVVAARAAGVPSVWVASPRPAPVTLAAAALAGADALLAAGGAHAIAALAFGAGPVPACDAVVGPGNRWVTAAKQVVSGHVRIDMLAGPSELVVVADGGADPALVAADLLAQAEHDPDALPVLVAIGEAVADAVDAEVARQLATLPTAGTAAAAVANGFAVVVRDAAGAAAVCDRIAPEHLELALDDAAGADVAGRVRHCGALFSGPFGGEVLGDYGAGPSHVLPTGGTARHTAGLSVLDFLRVRTWLDVRDREAARPLVEDAIALARMEGLEGHARAAERRR
ncbi:MAG: histidinol dehydrogenase [Deltaproteobacteria bacterium]|nr:histidinol dehydrogenase [Deltaproteobacteria bacterium]